MANWAWFNARPSRRARNYTAGATAIALGCYSAWNAYQNGGRNLDRTVLAAACALVLTVQAAWWGQKPRRRPSAFVALVCALVIAWTFYGYAHPSISPPVNIKDLISSTLSFGITGIWSLWPEQNPD